jgi:imidazolonepropionase-like amidohydrolase
LIYIKAGKIIDANGVKENQVVEIEGDRILEVKKSSQVDHSERNVIDGSSLTLMPGMIDCHVHFTGSVLGGIQKFAERFETRLIRSAVKEAKQLLDVGFTSVMDPGGLVGFHVRNAIDEGIVPGPKVYAAGRYIGITGGHGDTHYLPLEWVKQGLPFGWGMDGRIADGPDECLRAVREQLREGVDFIKILTSGGGGSLRDPPTIPEFTYPEIKIMVDEAHTWGRRVMAHCYNPEAIRRSVTAGIDILAHCNMADDESIKLMRERGTFVVPTMSIYHSISKRVAAGGSHPGQSKVNGMYSTLFKDIRRLYDGGLTLALGTDTMGDPLPFGKNALELQLYVEGVGLSPLEAVRIGTLNGAKVIGRDDLGTVEEGKVADLILLEKNPLDDIRCLQNADNTKLVMKGGNVVKGMKEFL